MCSIAVGRDIGNLSLPSPGSTLDQARKATASPGVVDTVTADELALLYRLQEIEEVSNAIEKEVAGAREDVKNKRK